ncbi:Pathogenesis-related homeodomain protein [Apostasia shenzhenica]|uniref:Pathogenesis-related homeodomain protein n=1 Tax=Apostasia shenzhenica TaxID=1088818 RepID=A0A2I0BDE3_9ASPA|nr:Pathogenesis-related homeodomain protein [Apostasia shenzhenica]
MERARKKTNVVNGKTKETLQKGSSDSLDKCRDSFKITRKRNYCIGNNSKNEAKDVEKRSIQRRVKMRKTVEHDEVSRLQRRARYLLVKMKLEQNLIDAYSGDGWKGHSREKLKPEKELQRAERQILKCKLGIRDAIRQLDVLGSEGRIEDSVMHPDGSVFHEHIFCAKCKSREAFPDNDIILCDGHCNCGFHQKCLNPPLEKIPPGDQGWLCKICDCKMVLLDTINAHLGTCFTVNSLWEDIFKEAIAAPDIDWASHSPTKDWPSDDSDDEDYYPGVISDRGEFDDYGDGCSSSDFICSSGASLNSMCLNSCESSDHEITAYRRQRKDVDYLKLYDEMFGKESIEGDEQSEDEDWGPYKRKHARSEIGIASRDCGGKDSHAKRALQEKISCDRRSFFRIPPGATVKLRQVFSENELPSRTVKENLSQQLGISAERVDKWFKNARYASLKIRKANASNQSLIGSEKSKKRRQISERTSKLDRSCLLPLASIFHLPRHMKRTGQRVNLTLFELTLKKRTEEALATVHSPEIQVKSLSKNDARRRRHGNGSDRNAPSEKYDAAPAHEQLCLDEMQRLWILENRLHQLKNVLLARKVDDEASSVKPHSGGVIFVPVVELKEKPGNF